jgi:hypothetical protein
MRLMSTILHRSRQVLVAWELYLAVVGDAIVEGVVEHVVHGVFVRDAPAASLISWLELTLVDHRRVGVCEDDTEPTIADFAEWYRCGSVVVSHVVVRVTVHVGRPFSFENVRFVNLI